MPGLVIQFIFKSDLVPLSWYAQIAYTTIATAVRRRREPPPPPRATALHCPRPDTAVATQEMRHSPKNDKRQTSRLEHTQFYRQLYTSWNLLLVAKNQVLWA